MSASEALTCALCDRESTTVAVSEEHGCLHSLLHRGRGYSNAGMGFAVNGDEGKPDVDTWTPVDLIGLVSGDYTRKLPRCSAVVTMSVSSIGSGFTRSQENRSRARAGWR